MHGNFQLKSQGNKGHLYMMAPSENSKVMFVGSSVVKLCKICVHLSMASPSALHSQICPEMHDSVIHL